MRCTGGHQPHIQMTLSRSLAKWAASKSSRPKSNPEEASREFDNVRASIGWHEVGEALGANVQDGVLRPRAETAMVPKQEVRECCIPKQGSNVPPRSLRRAPCPLVLAEQLSAKLLSQATS